MILNPALKFTLRKISFGEGFLPASVFGSNDGTWISLSDTSFLWQDDGGTVAVVSDSDPIGLFEDRSGNGNNGYQTTAGSRLLFKTDGTYNWGLFDGSDDAILIDVPVGGWSGTYMQGTTIGTIIGTVSLANGTYQLPVNTAWIANGTITELFIIDDAGSMDPATQADLKTYIDGKSSTQNFSSATTITGWFFGRSDFTSLDLSSWDTSSVSAVSSTFRGCTSLQTLDTTGWVTSGVTTAGAFLRDCSSLTTVDMSGWTFPIATNFTDFMRGCSSLVTVDVSNFNCGSATSMTGFALSCTSLTSLDISNWDTSSVTSFQNFASGCSSLSTVTVTGGTGSPLADSPCTNYSGAFSTTNLTQQSIDDILVAIDTAGTSNGTFNQSGGSAPSATGEAAITSLRGRGWTVTVTGGF